MMLDLSQHEAFFLAGVLNIRMKEIENDVKQWAFDPLLQAGTRVHVEEWHALKPIHDRLWTARFQAMAAEVAR